MYIYQYRYEKNSVFSRNISLTSLVDSMRKETGKKPVTKYRRKLLSTLPGQRNKYAERLPVNLFGGTFKREGNEAILRKYNGLILLEVDHLPEGDISRIRKETAAMPQTLLAFTGASGRSVKIVVRFTLPEGNLPEEEKAAMEFHEEAYRVAVKLYQPQLSTTIAVKTPMITRCCRMSYDPDLYFNPEAVAIRIEQPCSFLSSPREEVCVTPEKPSSFLDRLMPGVERNQQVLRIFRLVLLETLRTHKLKTIGDFHSVLITLAANCFQSGIPEEEGVQCCLLFREWLGEEDEIRETFRITYQLKQGFGKQLAIPKCQYLTFELEEFLNRRYIFRRNEMSGGIEYRDRSLLKFDFRPFSKEAKNSICIEARKEGIDAWDKDILRHVESEYIPSFHPIEYYLEHLPLWDGKDHIRALAGRVPNENPLWQDLFYRWMISMVAHWLEMEHTHANTTTPLLVGGQGCGKSTFCLNLLPPELRMYYTDTIDFSKRKDTELALHRYALINIDEFDMVKSTQQSYLKHILQKTHVNMRLPHRSTHTSLRRYATFIATSNTFDLLSDPTGSRRFLCVEVKGLIDNNQPIPYEQLYAQIIEAIRNGERFWLTREEEEALTRNNRNFQQTSLEEQLFFTYFRVPAPGEKGEPLLSAEIWKRIAEKRPEIKINHASINRLGRALRHHEIPVRRSEKGNHYWVAERS